jgi:hypothetical protein
MKISRKVGRRSHSSVSRRRLRNKKSYKKNSYRKKHTQRGGKHGKRGRAHKRARTHKHGKRFHRGGVLGFLRLGKQTSFDSNSGIIKNLKYIKTKPGETPSDRDDSFQVSVFVQNGQTTIYFSRTPSKRNRPLSFRFGPDSLDQDIDIKSLDKAIGIMNNSLMHGNSISNNDSGDDGVVYNLMCSDESILNSIVGYIRTKHYEITKAKPVMSVEGVADFLREMASKNTGEYQ